MPPTNCPSTNLGQGLPPRHGLQRVEALAHGGIAHTHPDLPVGVSARLRRLPQQLGLGQTGAKHHDPVVIDLVLNGFFVRCHCPSQSP